MYIEFSFSQTREGLNASFLTSSRVVVGTICISTRALPSDKLLAAVATESKRDCCFRTRIVFNGSKQGFFIHVVIGGKGGMHFFT